MKKSSFGVIGLAVMGQNLARNVARHYKVSVFNRSYEKTEKLLAEHGGSKLEGHKKIEDFVQSLEAPRKILIMVKAGAPVDGVITQLMPFLEEGDILIDGGNSHYPDTERREKELAELGFNFFGMGISGGEEGALNGPSMMPGGNRKAYESVAKILEKSAADDGNGGKCVSYVGKSASGHFVKMVHNGIEYGVMQLIAEIYDVLKRIGGYSNKELSATFKEWQNSYLLEITAKIFAHPENLIDKIKDLAGQKGTGKWTSVAAFDFGVSTPTIHAAVDARILSGAYESRQIGSKDLPVSLNPEAVPENLKGIAYNALKLASYATYNQGFDLICQANQEKEWEIDLGEVARIWRGGCIIRSEILDFFQHSFKIEKEKFHKEIQEIFTGEPQKHWRQFICLAINNGIPVPCMQSALSFYDGCRTARLPQNLTQAQRDFFGAHTFQRLDKEGTFHADWE